MTSRNVDPSVPLREDGAERVLSGVTNNITKNLVKYATGTARMRFMRPANLSDAEWVSQLPVAPFDMEFLTSVLCEVFSHVDTIERILKGEDVDSATGWNF